MVLKQNAAVRAGVSHLPTLHEALDWIPVLKEDGETNALVSCVVQ